MIETEAGLHRIAMRLLLPQQTHLGQSPPSFEAHPWPTSRQGHRCLPQLHSVTSVAKGFAVAVPQFSMSLQTTTASLRKIRRATELTIDDRDRGRPAPNSDASVVATTNSPRPKPALFRSAPMANISPRAPILTSVALRQLRGQGFCCCCSAVLHESANDNCFATEDTKSNGVNNR